MRLSRPAAWTAAFCLLVVSIAHAQAPVEYRLSFGDYVRHVMDVDVVFSDVTADPFEVHISRSSPGRYSLHEFVRNVYDVQISDGAGRPLTPAQPTLSSWRVKDHGGTVRMHYKVFGDRIDGTYFGLDVTQAHLNIPATLVWARTFETRPVKITFVPPPDVTWTVSTQLYPTADPLVYTAPNLAYLMDSPVQFGPQMLRTFQVPPIRSGNGNASGNGGGAPATIRVALRHDGTEADADRFVQKVEKIVREEQAIYGELPAYEPGSYTFLATYAGGASGDGMEHRNSTIVTSSGSLASSEHGLLGTVAHEFFHCWNVERIRPKTLEPFNFDDANVSGELWVAEGFTQYYGLLVMGRSGLATEQETLAQFAGLINSVNASPGRRVRFAPDMSRLAPLTDGANSSVPSNLGDTFLSYYTFGGAIALGLDLDLRDRTDGKVTLDDYMRALWTKYGKNPGPPGVVATPYTAIDLEATLAETAGSISFAREFFERYVNGPELEDYGMLLKRMGLVWRSKYPGRAWMGDLPTQATDAGARVIAVPRGGTPAYDAGFGEADVITAIGAAPIKNGIDITKAVEAAKPGDKLEVTFIRAGKEHKVSIGLRNEPTRELVTRESLGETPTPQELAMRAAWLGSRVRS
jgi:predicted metalloprotease with PDZ domain